MIAADIRDADRKEMLALGTTVEDALAEGLAHSDLAMTGLLDGVPVCMFGVSPLNIILGRGTPWMLATNRLEIAQVAFLRACRPVVKWMRESYPNLANVVHANNATAIRWLRWLGFRFCKDESGKLVDFNVNGHRFHVFMMGY